MSASVVGLYLPKLDAEIAPYEGRYEGLVAKYRRLIWYTADPRPEPYMRELFSRHHADGVFVNVNADPAWQQAAAGADTVVLLYPDAIGLGYGPLEREIAGLKKDWAAVRVLSGKRQQFLLTRAALLGLRMRRLFSRLLVGEMLFTVVFLVVTPLFLLVDWIGGRK